MSLNLSALLGKLDDTLRQTLGNASGLAISHTHYDVELEHWLVKLLEAGETDIPRVLRHFGMDPDRFLASLSRALDDYKTGNGGRPHFTETIQDLAVGGWIWSSVHFGLAKVRSGAIFLAALKDSQLRRRLLEIHPALKNVNVETLENEFVEIVGGSPEDREVSTDPRAVARDVQAAAPGSRTPSLDQYCVDLTREAREGRIDPVLGRDPEIRQIVDILMRRRQNNPILTGEAGVGKTAIVEGFALRIAAGDVPPPLANVTLRTLDLGLLQAGAGVKGEFENRLKSVIEEVKASPTPIILFI
ncbi:MAG: type VI secretion system ATPase TssH, partial [Myxococcota bacterium]